MMTSADIYAKIHNFKDYENKKGIIGCWCWHISNKHIQLKYKWNVKTASRGAFCVFLEPFLKYNIIERSLQKVEIK